MNSSHLELVEQAIWLLGNIGGNSIKDIDLVISAGAFTPISNIFDKAQPGSSLIRNLGWTIYNFCRSTQAANFDIV